MSGDPELLAAPGYIEPAVREEFPGLTLRWLTVPGPIGATPPEVKRHLRALSNRLIGSSVITMRTHPIPHAYRSFFRQVGLDPDTTRIPSEEAAVARLMQGGFRSDGLLNDALLIALVETGVPVWALDGERVDPGGPGIRTTQAGERFGIGGSQLPAGHLVVGDARRVHALLFGAIAPGHGAGPRARSVVLFAVGVQGVPDIHIEEALWQCSEMLGAG